MTRPRGGRAMEAAAQAAGSDEAALARYIEAHLPGFRGPVRAE